MRQGPRKLPSTDQRQAPLYPTLRVTVFTQLMLEHTFCHIPRIGAQTEAKLWADGVRCWADALSSDLPGPRGALIRDAAGRSIDRHNAGDARYFAQTLPTREHWRLYRDFAHRAAYLDIETTGLGGPDDHVTTIALYDGQTIRHYVHGQNLDQFEIDVADYDMVVTYNGKSFDLPFLRKFLRVDVDAAHLDLMHALRSVGHRGGLKAIEKRLGYDRPDMADIDGYFAVVLWHEYQRTGDDRVLETLLAYNVQDVLTLEPLAALAYNLHLRDTPFADELALDVPSLAHNPLQAHRDIVDTLQGHRMW
jgi:uncharacterized protein YprB with RNaseH-like and TPR domain